MVNKIDDENKEKEFLKRKFKAIITTYSIFAIIVFMLALLKKYSVISSNFSLIPFYFIMAIISFIIIFVLVCQMFKVGYNQQPSVSLGLSFIGMFLLVFFGIAIDVRKELIDFSKNSTKIDAYIIDNYKNVEFKRTCNGGRQGGTRCKEREYYEVYYTYDIRYVVKNQTYRTDYKDEKHKKEFNSKSDATNYKSEYNKGDYITIYYDNDNPKNIRGDFALGFGMVHFFEGIVILFHIFYFIKHRKYINDIAVSNVLPQ